MQAALDFLTLVAAWAVLVLGTVCVGVGSLVLAVWLLERGLEFALRRLQVYHLFVQWVWEKVRNR